MPCCGGSPFERAASLHFDGTKVADELAQYLENGPGPTTRLLVDGIAGAGALTGSVLDIGAGLGGLSFSLLERGASSATGVDASAAYVTAAEQEAARRGRAGAIHFIHADFVAHGAAIPPARIVTLDRVVCCYPAFEPLIDAAAAHADWCLALSYPRDVWWVRAAMRVENARRWFARNPFRTFVHPAAAIESLITRSGLRLSSRRTKGMWSADVYVRPSPRSPAGQT